MRRWHSWEEFRRKLILIALVFNLWLLVFLLVRVIYRALQEIEEQGAMRPRDRPTGRAGPL